MNIENVLNEEDALQKLEDGTDAAIVEELHSAPHLDKCWIYCKDDETAKAILQHLTSAYISKRTRAHQPILYFPGDSDTICQILEKRGLIEEY